MTNPERAAVVSGGASGIGLAAAKCLAAQGRTVALLDRDPAALHQAIELLGGAGMKAVTAHEVDVTDGAALDSAVCEIENVYGISTLINAAGILQLGTIDDVSVSDWDRMIDVNLKGVFLTCKTVMPMMVSAGGGAIVNVASQSGRTKSTFSAPNYVAAKAGVIGLTMVLANQAAVHGIRVNCVAPGLVETPMLSIYTAEQRQSMIDAIPLGRFANADEVADVIAYLVSRQSSYVTGQTINVNGGSFMQ